MIRNLIIAITFISFLFPVSYQAQSKVLTEADKIEAKKKKEVEMTSYQKPYHETENAEQKIAELILKAKKENKNIILQAGGNWCIWCLRFNNFVQTTPELKSLVDENYMYYHLNYSPKIRMKRFLPNTEILERNLGILFLLF